MSAQTTYLVTGANRGIGKGLVAAYLSVPKNTVIAAVRDPSHSTAQSLSQLPKGAESRLIVVRMDTGSSQSIAEAVEHIKVSHNIQSLDVVVSNAGFGEVGGKLTDTPLSLIQKYVEINAYGPLELFKSTLPLLGASKQPKFCTVTSVAASNTLLNTTVPTAPYNASKLLANHLIRWLASENPEVITWAIHPGLVETDMATSALEAFTKIDPDLVNALKPISIEESVEGINKVIAEASKEKTNGHFIAYDGAELPW